MSSFASGSIAAATIETSGVANLKVPFYSVLSGIKSAKLSAILTALSESSVFSTLVVLVLVVLA